jgi:CHAT domain-containing protein
VLARLKVSDPEYASLRSLDTLGAAEVSGLLDGQTTLLSFFVTPEETITFVITQNSLNVVEMKVGERELADVINELNEFADLESVPTGLNQLYTKLLTPLKGYLKTQVIGIIPHGVLQYVPFAALTDGRRPLSEEYTLFSLPSASVLPIVRKRGRGAGERLLAFAQSQAEGLAVLKFADKEVGTAAKLYGTRAVVGPDATETAFRNAASSYSVLLLAAHGELNSTHPLFSQIFLAPDKENDGVLQVHEIYGLSLKTGSLVVLSACETQLGAQSLGDDILAINRAFLSVGASSVVASLWRVDDEATEILMEEFFTRLRRGESRATALRAAQLKTRERFSHPYYWGAFVLTGDPGLIQIKQQSNR